MTAEPSYPGGVFADGSRGEPVWHRVAEFGFDGVRYRQEEDYFEFRPAGLSRLIRELA
jgi:hypothetical protein